MSETAIDRDEADEAEASVWEPWQIRSFPTAVREKLTAGAREMNMPVGAFVANLLRNKNGAAPPVKRQTPVSNELAKARELAEIVARLTESGADKSIRQEAHRALKGALRALTPALPAPPPAREA